MKDGRHNSGLDDNNTDERLERSHQTNPHFVHRVPDKHVFGTSDEVGHRVGGTMRSISDRNPSKFRQNGVSTPGGHGNFSDVQVPKAYGSGTTVRTKFGNAKKYS